MQHIGKQELFPSNSSFSRPTSCRYIQGRALSHHPELFISQRLVYPAQPAPIDPYLQRRMRRRKDGEHNCPAEDQVSERIPTSGFFFFFGDISIATTASLVLTSQFRQALCPAEVTFGTGLARRGWSSSAAGAVQLHNESRQFPARCISPVLGRVTRMLVLAKVSSFRAMAERMPV